MKRRIARYSVALVCVLAATTVRGLLDTFLERGQVFSLYYAAVAIAAWYGGLGPSLLTLVAGYLAADWFFADPRGAISLPADADALVPLIMYVSVSLGIIAIAIGRRAKSRRAVTFNTAELLDVANSVRKHGIGSRQLPEYLVGLNAAAETCSVAAQFNEIDLDPDELAERLEEIAHESEVAVSR